jgi:hypothetical protein
MALDNSKSLRETIEKLATSVDKLADSTAKSDADEVAASAAKEEKMEESFDRKEQLGYLKLIAAALAGGDEAKADKGGGKTGGIFSGIARSIGGLGAGIGKGVGGFMSGIGKEVLHAPGFVIMMGALGLGLGAFMLAVGGSARLISETFPGLAKNLKAFEGLNGKNLVDVGLGMAAIGVGLGAEGLGGAISATGTLVGGLADGISNVLGIKSGPNSVLEKMKLFGAAKIDAAGVKKNAAAMRDYGIAMMAAGGGKMLKGLGEITGAVFGKLSKMLGAVPPVKELELFGAATINHDGVKANAASMVTYLKAIVIGTGGDVIGAIGKLGNTVGTIMDGVSKFFGGKGFIDTAIGNMKKLSAVELKKKNISNFATALVDYLQIQVLGTGGSVIGVIGKLTNTVGTFFDYVSKWFGKSFIDTTIENMKKLSGVELKKTNITNFATAMVDYLEINAKGAGSSAWKALGSIPNAVKTFFDGVSKWLGGKGTLDSQIEGLKKVSVAGGALSLKNIKITAGAMVYYAQAMEDGAKGEAGKAGGAFSNMMSNIGDALSWMVGGGESNPIKDLKKFAESAISTKELTQIKINAEALGAYGIGMSKFVSAKLLKGKEDLLGGIVEGLTSVFSGDDKKPSILVALTKFAGKKISIPNVENNVKALNAFGKMGVGYTGGAAMKQYIADMITILPKVEALVDGVPASGAEVLGFRIGSRDVKGLADPDIDYKTATNNIKKLKAMVNVELSDRSPDQQMAEDKTNMLWAVSLQKSIDGLTQTIANINTGGNTLNQSNHNDWWFYDVPNATKPMDTSAGGVWRDVGR